MSVSLLSEARPSLQRATALPDTVLGTTAATEDVDHVSLLDATRSQRRVGTHRRAGASVGQVVAALFCLLKELGVNQAFDGCRSGTFGSDIGLEGFRTVWVGEREFHRDHLS